MCTYARTVFECRHQAWGRRLKLCAVAENHLGGDLGSDCALRKPHGLHSRRIARQCGKCSELDRKRGLLRAKLDECRNIIRRRCPDYGLGLRPGLGLGLGLRAAGDMEQASDGSSSGDEDEDDDGDTVPKRTGGKPLVLGA